MKKYILVVFLLLTSSLTQANQLSESIDGIERDWAITYYSNNQNTASPNYQKLLQKAQELSQAYPNNAEPLLWQAIIIASDADHQAPLSALEQVEAAKNLLEKAIAIDANGLNGAAQTALATLYYMTPPWPVSFGDNSKAKALFQAALRINPQSIEANYFYGDFLLSEHQATEAEQYFQTAMTISPRKNQYLADNSLQQQAAMALQKSDNRKLNQAKKLFLSDSHSNTEKTKQTD